MIFVWLGLASATKARPHSCAHSKICLTTVAFWCHVFRSFSDRDIHLAKSFDLCNSRRCAYCCFIPVAGPIHQPQISPSTRAITIDVEIIHSKTRRQSASCHVGHCCVPASLLPLIASPILSGLVIALNGNGQRRYIRLRVPLTVGHRRHSERNTPFGAVCQQLPFQSCKSPLP